MTSTEIKHGIIAGLVMVVLAGVAALIGLLSGINMKRVEESYSITQAEVTHLGRTSSYAGDNRAVGETFNRFKYDLDYTVSGTRYKIRKTGRWNLSQGLTNIYYNPDNPEQAYSEEQVLALSYRSWYWLAGIIGGLGLLVIIYVTFEWSRLIR